jgi:hypothetical protein
VHVAKDPGKQDAVQEHMHLLYPKRFFGYAGA